MHGLSLACGMRAVLLISQHSSKALCYSSGSESTQPLSLYILACCWRKLNAALFVARGVAADVLAYFKLVKLFSGVCSCFSFYIWLGGAAAGSMQTAVQQNQHSP